jgi:hypothetical protein
MWLTVIEWVAAVDAIALSLIGVVIVIGAAQ